MQIRAVDEHGRIEIKTWFLFLMSFIAVILNMWLGGYLLFVSELGAEGSNINSLDDAIWTALMFSSTVGFGDHFPVTLVGRIVGALLIAVGITNLGAFLEIGRSIVSVNQDVKVRQVMSKVVEIHRMMEEFELKFETQMKVCKESHMLDIVQDQMYICDQEENKYGWVTKGTDSTGDLILSLELHVEGRTLKRRIPADDQKHLDRLWNRYLPFKVEKED